MPSTYSAESATAAPRTVMSSRAADAPFEVVRATSGGRRHLPELDSLRGAAALIVVLNHFHQVWMGTQHPAWISRPRLNPLLWLLVNGHASVILFFLLSGFVLTLPSMRASTLAYRQFLLRRVLRIYPPYLVGLVLGIVGCSLFWGHTNFGPTASLFWEAPPDLHSILVHLAMLGRFDIYRYDGPIWSLVHEMRISIVFPLILLVAKRLKLWTTLAAAAGCALLASLSLLHVETGLSGKVGLTAWSLTLYFCGTFLLGAALALRHERLQHALELWDRPARIALLLVGLVLYLYPLGAVTYGIDMSDFVSSCGGMLLIVFCLAHRGRLTGWLRAAAMQFIGRISYSLYLVHYPILLMMVYSLHGHVSMGLLFCPFLTVCIVVAALLYKLVEVPSIAVGRTLSAAVQPARLRTLAAQPSGDGIPRIAL